jgi:hypothetical protein
MGLEGMGPIGHMALWTVVIWLLAMGIDNWQLITVTNVLLQSFKIGIVAQTIFQNTMLQIHGIHSKIIVPMSVVSNALSPQCCKPFSRLSFIYNSILSFLYTFIFSLYNYSGVC